MLGLAVGCSNGGRADPLAVLQNPQREPSARLAAAERIGPIAQAADPDQYRAILSRIAWSDRQPTPLRCYAIDRLIEDDPAAFWEEADRCIVEVDVWPVLEHLFARAKRSPPAGFVRTLVRSYARPSQRIADAQRPERGLIAALSPGRSVEEAVFEVFAGFAPQGAPVTPTHQMDAWVLLSRLVEPAQLRAMLEAAPPRTPIVEHLQAAAQVLDVLPTTRQSVLWLIYLREGEPQLWDAATARAVQLNPSQRRGLALRHLPWLTFAQEPLLQADRAALLAQLHQRLTARAHHLRRDQVGDDWTESLQDQQDRLAWADLLTLRVLMDAMEAPSLAADLFAQADADQADRQSEHGGVLRRIEGRWRAVGLAPAFPTHDRSFVAPPELILDLYAGGVHYHFHAQEPRNAAYAGPGRGDLDFADRFTAAALVFTFIDRDTLNVDFYQPGSVVVDLGVIQRP
ncbi:MAG TPA: hypothetical protein VF184_12305 [Phycisphaeraceae bacterium]